MYQVWTVTFAKLCLIMGFEGILGDRSLFIFQTARECGSVWVTMRRIIEQEVASNSLRTRENSYIPSITMGQNTDLL